jgi:hypothetical protein
MADLIEFFGLECFWGWVLGTADFDGINLINNRSPEVLWREERSLGLLFHGPGRVGYMTLFSDPAGGFLCAFATTGLQQEIHQVRNCTPCDILDLIIS